jgi:hypothetical protein
VDSQGKYQNKTYSAKSPCVFVCEDITHYLVPSFFVVSFGTKIINRASLAQVVCLFLPKFSLMTRLYLCAFSIFVRDFVKSEKK